MFNSPIAKAVYLIVITISLLLLFIFVVLPLNNIVLTIFSVIVIAALVFTIQLYHSFTLFRRDSEDQKKTMRPCPYCEIPIYKTDQVCPYCKKSLND